MREAVQDCDDFDRSIADALPVLDNDPKILNLGIGTGLELEPSSSDFPEPELQGLMSLLACSTCCHIKIGLGSKTLPLLDLCSRIHRALLPNGSSVNGDYIVSSDESSGDWLLLQKLA